MAKIKLVKLNLEELDKAKSEYFKNYHPAGYGTSVDDEGFVYQDKEGKVPNVYSVTIGNRTFLTDDIDVAKREINCYSRFIPDTKIEVINSPYYYAEISRFDSCD